MTKRQAAHSGSWYSDSTSRLSQELDHYIAAVPSQVATGDTLPILGVRAIIAPHAGYAYSGPTAAYAYKCVNVDAIERLFILGPSHHVYLEGCALSSCDSYETPLGDLQLDKAVLQELYDTGHFEWMRKSVDEDEHSLEMHLPFTAKIFSGKLEKVKIVPILVGNLSVTKEKLYGELLAKYLVDEHTLFIISSDFCHWGERFSYTAYRPSRSSPLIRLSSRDEITTPIHASISDLDHQGMEIIESLDHGAFERYLRETRNTICGRHPIGVLLAALARLRPEHPQRVRFIKYAQSNPCQKIRDSSVSYASAYVYMA